MEAYERGSGRPRKDGLVRDKEGNLRDPEGLITTEEDWAQLVAEKFAAQERDIPEDEPEVPNVSASVSADDSVVADLVAEVRRLREQVESQTPARDRPSGKWEYDYQKQAHLRVMGGLEVEHPKGFRPKPPSGIPMYVATDGGTTDHITPPVKKYIKYDQTGANPLKDEHGQTQYTEINVACGAAVDAEGEPILTDEYKLWLHVKGKGGRLNSTVLSDISAGKGLPQDAVMEHNVEFGDNGIPLTNSD